MLDLRGMLRPERAAFIDLLADLDEAEWSASTECPAWSVKGIALHVLGDDLSLLSRQRDATTPGTFLYAEDHPGVGFRELLDGFNEQWVHAARFLSTELIRELLRQTGEWTAAFYDATDPESLGEPVGFFAAPGPSPYWQICAREYVERWAHHQQIRRAVARPDLGSELLVAAGDVITTALAVHLSDLGADVILEIPAVATWPLHPDPTDEAADVTLTVDPTRAVAALSRGLTAAELDVAITTTGDAASAQAAKQRITTVLARP